MQAKDRAAAGSNAGSRDLSREQRASSANSLGSERTWMQGSRRLKRWPQVEQTIHRTPMRLKKWRCSFLGPEVVWRRKKGNECTSAADREERSVQYFEYSTVFAGRIKERMKKIGSVEMGRRLRTTRSKVFEKGRSLERVGEQERDGGMEEAVKMRQHSAESS